MNFIKQWFIERQVRKWIRRLDAMPKIKGYRTVAINVVSGLAFFLGWDVLTQLVDPKWIAEGLVFLNILLRYLTTTPVGVSSTGGGGT